MNVGEWPEITWGHVGGVKTSCKSLHDRGNWENGEQAQGLGKARELWNCQSQWVGSG